MSEDAHFDNLVLISKLLINNDLNEIVTPKIDEQEWVKFWKNNIEIQFCFKNSRWLISPTTLNAIHVYERVQISKYFRILISFWYCYKFLLIWF